MFDQLVTSFTVTTFAEISGSSELAFDAPVEFPSTFGGTHRPGLGLTF